MKNMMMLAAAVLFIVGSASAQSSADSVTITFRAHKSAGTPVSLPGQFSGWSTANTMSFDSDLQAWTKTYVFKIHDAGRTPLGDSVYQYKFNDGNWYSDPLNPEQNPNDNSNSVLRLTKLFFFQLYTEVSGNDITRLTVGIVHTNADAITSVKLYTGVNALTATMTDITSAFIPSKRTLNYPFPSSIPKTNYIKVVAKNDKGDSIVYQNSVFEIQLLPMPGYAKHGVTPSSGASGDSTTFRLRVPGKSFVVLRIAPSGQAVATASPRVMRKDPSTDNWWLNVKLDANTEYEYLYELDNGQMVTDPYGRYVGTYGTKFSTGAYGLAADNFVWTATDYQRPPLNKIAIYELNVGEFGGGYYNLGGGQSGFANVTSLLSHFKSLGINAIELMPVNDYGSVGKSGFSWGYDLNSYFAIEPAYGTPLELKTLINEAHKLGIAVIIDVVYNHQNDTGPLWKMLPDEAANPYFKLNSDMRYNEDGLAFFKDMDHWTSETQEMVFENLKMWIDEYKVDGFRYDYTQGIGWNTSEPTKGILGWANKVDTLYQGKIYQIAEHLPGSPALIYHSGMTGGWHDAFRDKIFDESRFKNVPLADFQNFVLGLSEFGGNDTPSSPSSYGGRTEPVNASVTHDEQSLIYEMTNFQSVPLNEAILRDKLYSTFAFTSVGIPMIWQGQEMSASRGWTSDNQKLSYRPLEWSLLNQQRGQDQFKYHQTLIKQRVMNPALYQGALALTQQFGVEKTFVYGFDDAATGSQVMVVANLSGSNQSLSNVQWFGAGTWYDVFDQSQYVTAGSSVPNFSVNAYTARVFSNKNNNQLGITSVAPVRSGVPAEFSLSQNYPNPFNPATSISYSIPVSGHVTLKVYDMLGREVMTLADDMHSAGSYSVRFEAGSLSSGMYLYTLRSGSNVSTKRLLLIK